MTPNALRSPAAAAKITPRAAQSRESVKKSAEAPCRPRQATRCFTKLCARSLCKLREIQRRVSYVFFFVINEELQSVVNEDLNGKLPAQILDTECVEGKRVLTMCQYISLMRKRIEGKEGVSEIGDIEQLEQFLNNRTK